MEIYKKVLTFSTILETKHNENVIDYFENTVPKYSTMKRVIKNVNYVNNIFYFTVLFGEWALQV